MSLLWTEAVAEPDDDWRSARPQMFGRKPSELYGKVGDVDDYFNGASTRPTPWQQQGRSKSLQDYDHDVVKKMLQDPSHPLTDVDPRILRSSQPAITRGGVKHYLSDGEHAKTGETFADKGNAGNVHPVVYVHENGDHVLLSGHHRATAALFEGRPLRARVVHGGRPPR
jgi:hypothetical protein